MLKLKLLLEKQEKLMREKFAEESREKEEKGNRENKKLIFLQNNELKNTQNTEVPADDQINDLTKYNFQKNSTNLQMMGSQINTHVKLNDMNLNKSRTSQFENKINLRDLKGSDVFVKLNEKNFEENTDGADFNERSEVFENLIGNLINIYFLKK